MWVQSRACGWHTCTSPKPGKGVRTRWGVSNQPHWVDPSLWILTSIQIPVPIGPETPCLCKV